MLNKQALICALVERGSFDSNDILAAADVVEKLHEKGELIKSSLNALSTNMQLGTLGQDLKEEKDIFDLMSIMNKMMILAISQNWTFEQIQSLFDKIPELLK